MKRYRNWIIALVLSVTAGVVALQNNIAPTSADVTGTPTSTSQSVIVITDTPVNTLAYEGCAYTWAYHYAPELKEKLDSAIRALDSTAYVNVNLYGEDCVYADGRSTFSARETDFYVYLTVDDLTANESFGNWIAQIMPLIIEIPREEIQGSYGFVEFSFEKTDVEKLIVRVPIQKYINDAQGITGEELLRMFLETP